MPPRSGVRLSPGTTAAPTNNRQQPHVRSAGGRAGALQNMGPAGYLWLLVLLEVGAIAALRHVFRDHHGG